MPIEFSSQELLIGVTSIVLLILIVGTLLHKRLKNLRRGFAHAAMVNIPHVENHILHLMPYKFRSRLIGLGMICSVFFALMALNWTIDEYPIRELDVAVAEDSEMITVVDLITPPIPPAPLPDLPVDREVETIDDYLIPEDDLELLDPYEETSEVFDEFIPLPHMENPVVFTPPPLPEKKPDDIIEIFKIVEEMPLFGNCESKNCSDAALISFILKHVRYPDKARDNNIQGRVTVEFVVETNGKVSQIAIIKGIGGGCDEEVLKVIRQMNAVGPLWSAGKQRGKPVRVLYRLPVTFSLN